MKALRSFLTGQGPYSAKRIVVFFAALSFTWILVEQWFFGSIKEAFSLEGAGFELVKDFILMALSSVLLYVVIRRVEVITWNSRQQLELALRGAELGYWDLDLRSGEVEFNSRWVSMLGYEAGEFDGSFAAWKAHVHPEDLLRLTDCMERHARQEIEMIDIEYRMRHRDGRWMWVQNRGKILEWDREGKAVRALGTHFDITERKRHEEELRQLSLVASKTHHGVVISDSMARVQWVNDSYEKITGFSLPEIRGKYPGEYMRGPQTDPLTIQRIVEGLRVKRVVKEEILYYRRSGEKRWLQVEVTPILNDKGEVEQFISIESDITERKHAEHQRFLLETAIKNLAEAVLIIDRGEYDRPLNFRVAYSNPAFFKISGYSQAETEGRNPLRLLQGPDTDNAKLQRIMEAVIKGELIEEEVISYRKDGQQVWIRLEVSPVELMPGRRSRYFVAIVKDINDNRLIQTERDKLTNEVIQRNKELQEFAQVVSHNLRAPVANILGLLQIMDYSQPIGDYNHKLLGYLKDAASNIDRILIDLHEVLSVKDSILESRNKFELGELVRQVLQSIRIQIEQANADVQLELRPAVLHLHSVRGYFHSIIYNLATNGLKYRHPDRRLRLTIGAYEAGGKLVIYVKDNGLGLDLKVVREKLFKLYKRFHSHVEGKGMGLFLVRSQVEKLGGNVSVYSRLGEGSLFKIVIPPEHLLKIEVREEKLAAV